MAYFNPLKAFNKKKTNKPGENLQTLQHLIKFSTCHILLAGIPKQSIIFLTFLCAWDIENPHQAATSASGRDKNSTRGSYLYVAHISSVFKYVNPKKVGLKKCQRLNLSMEY